MLNRHKFWPHSTRLSKREPRLGRRRIPHGRHRAHARDQGGVRGRRGSSRRKIKTTPTLVKIESRCLSSPPSTPPFRPGSRTGSASRRRRSARAGRRSGKAGNTLIAAPTGSGKTLAAFLSAIDALIRQGSDLPDETQVLYVSPLARSVERRPEEPAGAARRDPRSRPVGPRGARPRPHGRHAAGRAHGDDAPAAAHPRHDAGVALPPPHERGRPPNAAHGLDRHRRRDPRARSATSGEAISRSRSSGSSTSPAGPFSAIGLSATQKPLDEVGRFLVGDGRDCTLVDAGTFRELDLGDRDPAVAARDRLLARAVGRRSTRASAELIREHRTTLVFVNTRKMAERISGAAHAPPRRGRRDEPPRQPLARRGVSTPSSA